MNPQRKKSLSKNKRQTYKDGYVEFRTKEQAKNAELVFNGNLIGGRKGGLFYDDFLILKFRDNI